MRKKKVFRLAEAKKGVLKKEIRQGDIFSGPKGLKKGGVSG